MISLCGDTVTAASLPLVDWFRYNQQPHAVVRDLLRSLLLQSSSIMADIKDTKALKVFWVKGVLDVVGGHAGGLAEAFSRCGRVYLGRLRRPC